MADNSKPAPFFLNPVRAPLVSFGWTATSSTSLSFIFVSKIVKGPHHWHSVRDCGEILRSRRNLFLNTGGFNQMRQRYG